MSPPEMKTIWSLSGDHAGSEPAPRSTGAPQAGEMSATVTAPPPDTNATFVPRGEIAGSEPAQSAVSFVPPTSTFRRPELA